MKGPSAVVERMPRSGIRAVMELAAQHDDVCLLGFGEPDLPTPPHVVEAAAKAARDGQTRYTPSGGTLALREAAAAKMQRVDGIAADVPSTFAGAGGVGVLTSAVLGLVEPGDALLVPDLAWPNYTSIAALAGARVVTYRLDPAEGWAPDLEHLDAVARESGARALIANTPSNPSGGVWPRASVEGVLEACRRHDMRLISDEVYDELVFDGEHVSAAPLDDEGRVVTVFSCSKTYAMTGWRLGYAHCDPALLPSLVKVQESTLSCPCSVSQAAAVAALSGPQDGVVAMRETYARRRDLAVSLLERHGLAIGRPSGAFYALARVGGPDADTDAIARRLVSEGGVAVAPGATFGPAGAGLVRLSLAASEETIEQGIGRLAAALAAWRE